MIASGDTKEEPSGIRSFRLVFRASTSVSLIESLIQGK